MMFAFVVFVTALTVVIAVPGHIGEAPLTKLLSTNNSTVTKHAETNKLYDGREPKKSDLSTLKAKGEVKLPLDQKIRLKLAIINRLTERLPMEKKKNFTKSFMNLLLKQKDTNQTLLAAKSAALKNIVKSETREAEKANNRTTAVYTGVALNTDTAENSTQSQKSTSSDINSNETPVQSDNVMKKDIKGKHRRMDSRVASPSHPLLFEIGEDVQRKRINSDQNDDDDEDDEDHDDILDEIRNLERQLNSNVQAKSTATLFSDASIFGNQPVQQREPIQQSRVIQLGRPIQPNQTPNTWQQRPQTFPNTIVANSLEGTPKINTIKHFSDITDPEQEIIRLEKLLNFAEGFAQTANDRMPSIQNENDLFEAFNDENSFLNRLQGNFQNVDEHDQDSRENNAFHHSSPGRDFSQINTPNDSIRPTIARINENRELHKEDSGEETKKDIVKSLKNDIHRFLSGSFQSNENTNLKGNSHSNNKQEPESREEDESQPGIRNVFRISERDRNAPNLIAAVLHDNRNPNVNAPRFNTERRMQKEDSDEERESKVTSNEIHIYQNKDSQSYEYDNSKEKNVMGNTDQIKSESKGTSKGRNSGNTESASIDSNSASNEQNSREENSGERSESSYERSRKSKSGSSEKGSSDEKSSESKSRSSDSDSRSSEQDSSGENYDNANSSKDSSKSRSSGSNSKSSEQESRSKSSESSKSSERSKKGSKSSEESSKDSKSSESSENGSKSSEKSKDDSKSSESSDSKSSEESSESKEELPQQIHPQRHPPKKNNDLPFNSPKPENLYTPTLPDERKIFGREPYPPKKNNDLPLNNPKPENLYTPTEDRKIFDYEPEPDPPKETQVNWDFLDDNNFGNLNLYQPINDDQDLLDAILEIEKKNYGIEEMKSDSSEYSKERNYYKPKQYKGYTQYSDDRKIYKKSRYIDNHKVYGNRRKYSGYSIYRPKYMYSQSKYDGHKLKLTDKELYELNQIYRASKGHRPARVVRTWNTHHYPALVERNRQVRAYLLGDIGNDNPGMYGRRGGQDRRGYGNRRSIYSTRQPYGRFNVRRGLTRNNHPVIENRDYHWRNIRPSFENRNYYYPDIHLRR